MKASRRSIASLALLFLVLSSSNCKRMARVADCRKLSTHVNAALDEISARQDAGGANSETYRALADRYDKLGRDVDTFAKTEDAYGRAVKEYAGFLQETSAALRLLGEAEDRRDFVGAVKVRRDLGVLVKRDKTAITHIDVACATP